MGIGPVFRERPEYSTINARAETVTSSPTFREEMKRRRCLVPATGFYEWQKIGNKPKQPWTIELLNGEIFALAGLWDRWKDRATGSVLETYTIITTDPNELVQPMHDRGIQAPVDIQEKCAAPTLLPGTGDGRQTGHGMHRRAAVA